MRANWRSESFGVAIVQILDAIGLIDNESVRGRGLPPSRQCVARRINPAQTVVVRGWGKPRPDARMRAQPAVGTVL